MITRVSTKKEIVKFTKYSKTGSQHSVTAEIIHDENRVKILRQDGKSEFLFNNPKNTMIVAELIKEAAEYGQKRLEDERRIETARNGAN